MADSPFIIDVTRNNFAQVMETSSEVPVLLDFWASWCQPCRVLMPILAKLAEEYEGRFVLGKLNTEDEQEIAARFRIRSIPNVKLFRDGQVVDEFMGALPESAIRKFLDRHVARKSDAAVERARARMLDGDADGAIILLQEARESDRDNPRITLALAEAQSATGDIEGAEATLESLPADMQDVPEVSNLRSRLFFEGQLAGAAVATELEARLAADPGDREALYKLGLRKAVEADYDRAVELLLQLMRTDRTFGDDAARRGLLNVFKLLGDDPRVSRYRSRMASLLH